MASLSRSANKFLLSYEHLAARMPSSFLAFFNFYYNYTQTFSFPISVEFLIDLLNYFIFA